MRSRRRRCRARNRRRWRDHINAISGTERSKPRFSCEATTSRVADDQDIAAPRNHPLDIGEARGVEFEPAEGGPLHLALVLGEGERQTHLALERVDAGGPLGLHGAQGGGDLQAIGSRLASRQDQPGHRHHLGIPLQQAGSRQGETVLAEVLEDGKDAGDVGQARGGEQFVTHRDLRVRVENGREEGGPGARDPAGEDVLHHRHGAMKRVGPGTVAHP